MNNLWFDFNQKRDAGEGRALAELSFQQNETLQ